MDTAANAPDTVLLTTEQAGEFLNMSPRTLEKYRTNGGGPRFRKQGRSVRYKKTDLEAWSDSRSCESTFDPAYEALFR